VSAPTLPASRYVDADAFIRGLRLRRPAEGWASVAAAALLTVVVAWSIDDAGWIPTLEGSTGYLVWLAIGSTLVAVAAGKLGLGRWRTAAIGAAIGGLLLPLIAGEIVLSNANVPLDLAGLAARYQATAAVTARVWQDLAVEGRPFTSEYGHYHLVFGALVWAAGQVAGSASIGRHRPLDAIVVTGMLLLTNMGLTARPQLQLLVVFSVAALVLLIRSHVFEEQSTWVRRRIGDPGAVSGLYLRGGGTFIAGAVLGALVLTATATSAPLGGLMAQVPQRLAEFAEWIRRVAPSGGDPRPSGLIGFGSSSTTDGHWTPGQGIAFVAQVPSNELQRFKWRAGTYADYTLFGWTWGETASITRGANAPVLAGTGDDPARDTGRRPVRVRVEPQGYVGSAILSPESIDWVDRDSTVRTIGERLRFTVVESSGGSGPYVVNALVPVVGDVPGGITENRLRAAGRNFPSDIVATYLRVPENAMGTAATALLKTVEDSLDTGAGQQPNPYDLTRALETYLHDRRNFAYSIDVRDEMKTDCGGVSTVECFARIKRGYCEFYASTMAILLRKAGIPTRIAYGFLPGERTTDGIETVPASGAHWWVEVYFPKSGWIEFDPTGGDVGEPQVIPSGAPVTPAPSGLQTVNPDDETDPPLASRAAAPGGPTGGPGGPAPFIVLAILLALGVGSIGIAAGRRGPRKPMHPDQAWGSLGRLAMRFGLGPRPQQTVYEYAGALGELVPDARPELTTVARAKVEVAYGRRDLGVDRLRSVGEAYRRLRVTIIRFGLRRLTRIRRRR
jgi:hypothetical protein